MQSHYISGEDGCGCTVSSYTQITDLFNRSLSRSLFHLHWLRPNGYTQPACFLPCNFFFFCVWEEMTSQLQVLPQIHWKQMSSKRLSDGVWLWVARGSASVATKESLRQNNQAIKQLFWKGHCEICLLDAKRLRETLHVKVGPLFFSQTLWWVVSSCWQYMLTLQLEYIYCFTQKVSPCHLNAYLYYLRVLTKFLFDCCF